MAAAGLLQSLHIGLLGGQLHLDGVGAELLGVNVGVLGLLAGEGVGHGVLNGNRADGGAGYRVHIAHALGLEHGGGHHLHGLGADALGLGVLGHGDAIDPVPVGGDFHGDRAVAPVCRAGEDHRFLGDLAVLHAGYRIHPFQRSAEDRQDQQQDAAADADSIQAFLLLLFLVHLFLPEADPKSFPVSELPLLYILTDTGEKYKSLF